MKIRIASTLLALALPLVAQDAPASQVEAVFYKAYYLEKGQRDFAGAMTLYQEFLEKAPTHKLAAEAAKQQFRLLDRTGKTKERDAFQAKYKDLIGTMVAGGTRPTRPERGDRPEGGRGERGDRMREMMGDEIADKLTKASDDLKKALDAGKMEDADKALEALKEAFPMGRGRGGRGGDQGGRRRGRGGEEGGRGRVDVARAHVSDRGRARSGLGRRGRGVRSHAGPIG